MKQLPFLVMSCLAACQPDAPKIQQQPEPAPDVVDTDVGVAIDQPDIEVEPAELRFGQRPPDCPSPPETVTIRNVGNRPLRIDAVEIRGQDGGVYQLQGQIPGNLPAGREFTVDVTFQPVQVDTDYERARVFVASNDPDESEVRVDLLGSGSLALMAEELFVQQQASGVDILWVLDNSGSMASAVNNLRNSMSTFIAAMVNLGLDYRIGVTTTDARAASTVGAEGEFVDRWLDGGVLSEQEMIQGFEDQAGEVADQIAAGDYGSATEEGRRAAKMALTSAASHPHNTGFLRPDATLAVAVLSDEDDDTSESVNNWVSWFAGLKGGDMRRVSFSGIVPANAGNYRSAINQTGGVFSPIAQTDVNPFLTFLSFVASGLEISFPLGEEPLAATAQAITVQVCDAQGNCDTAPRSILDGWTYDAANNAIDMNGEWIPEPGETLIVTYPVESDCPA